MPRAKQDDVAEAEGTGAARAAGAVDATAEFPGEAGQVAKVANGRDGKSANGSAVKAVPKKAVGAAKAEPAKAAIAKETVAPTKQAKVKEAHVKGAHVNEAHVAPAPGKSAAVKGPAPKAAVSTDAKASEATQHKVAVKPAKAEGHKEVAAAKAEHAPKAEQAAKAGPVATSAHSAKAAHAPKAAHATQVEAETGEAGGHKAEAHKAEAHKAEAHKAAPPKAANPVKAAPVPVPPEDDVPQALFYEHQKALLLAERNNYTRQAEELRAQAAALALEHEPGDVQFDEEGGEGGTANVDRELDLHLSAQAQAAIEEIDAAMAKIEAGTYGICESCGNPVPKARLEAIPHARLCVTCKSGGLSRRQ